MNFGISPTVKRAPVHDVSNILMPFCNSSWPMVLVKD